VPVIASTARARSRPGGESNASLASWITAERNHAGDRPPVEQPCRHRRTRIVVLEAPPKKKKGAVSDAASHEDLLQRGGVYAASWPCVRAGLRPDEALQPLSGAFQRSFRRMLRMESELCVPGLRRPWRSTPARFTVL